MFEAIPRLPLYWSYSTFGVPQLLPLNLTVSVTYRCNSRCRTCRIYERRADELKLDEYRRIFRRLGRAPIWVTISGGEPFLRRDLAGICACLYRYCRPRVINIPTNGILHERIPEDVARICAAAPRSRVIVNLSLDGVGGDHDEIRGVPGNYAKAMLTWQGLRKVKKQLRSKNLTLGIHTVISKFNVKKIPEIVPELLDLRPDSYVTEIAENRVELLTTDLEIGPDPEHYQEAIDIVIQQIQGRPFLGVSRVIQAFRREYYQHVKKILRGAPSRWACQAGFASAQIMPDGDVWACCIKGETLGSLRQSNCDFAAVWFSPQARQLREKLRRENCCCPLANAAYTNMLCSPPTLARVLGQILKPAGARL